MNDEITFIYQGKMYPVGIELLKRHSNFFSREEESKISSNQYVNLLNEFDSRFNLKEETVYEFFKYFHSQKIDLTNDNIFSLQYLCHKHEHEFI